MLIWGQVSDFRSDEVTFPALHLYGIPAVYPNTEWERPVWFWPPPALCVCVCTLVCSALVCSTCVWHYCDKAAQPLRGDGECQRLERRSEQLPNILMEWETHSLDGWPADAIAWEQSRGWRPSKTPNVCVWNITLSLFRSPTCAHILSHSQY